MKKIEINDCDYDALGLVAKAMNEGDLAYTFNDAVNALLDKHREYLRSYLNRHPEDKPKGWL